MGNVSLSERFSQVACWHGVINGAQHVMQEFLFSA